MNILTIPFRNLRRRWLRSVLLILVFSLGVTAVVALDRVSETVGHSLEKKLTAFGANIVISPKTESLTLSYGGFDMGDLLFDVQYLDRFKVENEVRNIELKDRISAVAPKLVHMSRVRETTVAVVGVNWSEELLIKDYWAVTGAFPKGESQLLAGSRAATKLGLAPGDVVRLEDRAFEVSGVLMDTGGDDDNVLFVGLESLQAATGRQGQISFVEISALCSGCPIGDIVDQLAAALPDTEIKALQNVVRQRMYSVHFVQQLIMTVSLIILITACFMVGLSMLSSVNERKREIGILRSLGYSRSRIFSVFCLEAAFLGMAAGVVGYLGGWQVSLQVLESLDIAEVSSGSAGSSVLGIRPVLGILVCLGVALVAAVSAVLPAWKASRVEPSEALIAM